MKYKQGDGVPAFHASDRTKKTQFRFFWETALIAGADLSWQASADICQHIQKSLILPEHRPANATAAYQAVRGLIGGIHKLLVRADNALLIDFRPLTYDMRREMVEVAIWYFWFRWNASAFDIDFATTNFIDVRMMRTKTMELILDNPRTRVPTIEIEMGNIGIELPPLLRINVWGGM
jgi:hypothetical protein